MSLFNHPFKFPATGTLMDETGLFGIERGSDGMLRPVGPQGSRSKVGLPDAPASFLWQMFGPETDDIRYLQDEGEEAEALNEAYQFTITWDRMAEGAMRGYMFELAPEGLRMGNSLARVALAEDGLIYLKAQDDTRSAEGVLPEVAVAIIRQWEGLDAAADLAVESINPEDYVHTSSICAALIQRWDISAKAMKELGALQAA
jgi:hypothetical protein